MREQVVRTKASGLNPIDTKIRGGGFKPAAPPEAVLGWDGSGIVEQVGTQVQKFKKGDEVYFAGAPRFQGRNRFG